MGVRGVIILDPQHALKVKLSRTERGEQGGSGPIGWKMEKEESVPGIFPNLNVEGGGRTRRFHY